MTPIQLARVASMEREMKIALAFAQWWTAAASNGHALKRAMRHGTDGPPLTDAEKVNDAMETAGAHIMRAKDISDEIAKIQFGG